MTDVDVVLNLREIKDAGESERIVHIEMDPEHRILLTRFQLTVKPEVILVGKISRFSGPERFGGVHHLLLIRVDILAVLPFLLLSADDGNGEETAVLAEKSVDSHLLEKLLIVIVDVKDHIGATVPFLYLMHLEFRTAVAAPFHSLGSLLVGKRTDHDLLRHHECRIEAEAKVAYD